MSNGVTTSERLRAATQLPNGARFFRCALQVNPFAYLVRHTKTTPFSTEEDYNAAIVGTCHELGIEVIAVTDHYRVHDSTALLKAARDSGLVAFGGFEAVTKDGVHLLCLFDPDKDDRLQNFIGACTHGDTSLSPVGKLDCEEILDLQRDWGSICIAAHVAADGGGLLKKLSGQTRVNVWKSPHLFACALAGPVAEAPDGLRSILENKDAEHKRERPVAIINAQDVNGPEDLRKPGASCYIKMSSPTAEALRQAFLDPASRVRLTSEPSPDPHAEFLAIAWEGGFLRDTAVHWNPNLNVLVGGRGTGKSTMIESIRYVLGLEPVSDDARKAHEGVVKQVLRAGTKISLLVRSHKPSQRSYTIERTIPNPPVVKDEAGTVLSLTPRDVMPGVEVFGQHEISELTKSPEKQTLLLERFVDRDASVAGQKNRLRLELERSRSRIADVQREIKSVDERLSALPGLEETLKRFQEAGLEDRLSEKSLLVREEAILRVMGERITPIRELRQEFGDALPLDIAFLSPKALEALPNADIIGQAREIFSTLSATLEVIGTQIDVALKNADDSIAKLRERWDGRRKVVEATYEKLLRELQKSKVDGEEFIRLRRQIEELRPLRERRDVLTRELATHETSRRQFLDEWENAKAADYRAIQAAAKKVSKKLRDRVRVEVTMAGNREPLERLLREVGGNLSAALDRLRERSQLSLPELAARCREGKEVLSKQFSLPPASADRIAQGGPDLFMRIEELELPATTKIELNTAAEGEPPDWQSLDELSTGQKATAVLLLLLLESESPLVVDQPEDDLDNRFITEGVVPIMRQEKRRRQFVFSTHNANIPVLGDAELILGLGATGEAKEGQAAIGLEHMGSIDTQAVRELVEEILEGGKTAFEMRRLKYGF